VPGDDGERVREIVEPLLVVQARQEQDVGRPLQLRMAPVKRAGLRHRLELLEEDPVRNHLHRRGEAQRGQQLSLVAVEHVQERRPIQHRPL
jgi:hypothetical protein